MKKIIFAFFAALTMLSCTPTDGPDDGKTEELPVGVPELVVTKNLIVNDGVDFSEFEVTVNDIDVAEHSTMYYSLGTEEAVEFTEDKFTATIEGDYYFYVIYQEEKSNVRLVKVVAAGVGLPEDPQPESIDFKSRVLVNYFTGTDCAYCPWMSTGLKELEKAGYDEKMLIVANHDYNGGPLASPFKPSLANAVGGVIAHPTVCFDLNSFSKQQGASSPEPEKAAEPLKVLVDSELDDVAQIGISASTVVEGNVLKVSVGVKSGKTADYKLGMFLVEDKLIADQAGDSPEYEEYDLSTHYNVIRATSNSVPSNNYDFKGERLGTINEGEETTISLEIDLNPIWVTENCRVVIYVTAGVPAGSLNYYVRNVVSCGVNSKVAYEYN